VDLSLKDLVTLRLLAHDGFEHRVWDKEGTFAFKSKEEAEEATHAIGRLEFRIPKSLRPDPDDPYAWSFNRQTSIWTRWPSDRGSSQPI
jgi:hypothetical protein